MGRIPKDYDGVYHADEWTGNKKEAIQTFKTEFPNREVVTVVTIKRAKKHFIQEGLGTGTAGKYDIYYMERGQKYGYKGALFACDHVIKGQRKPELPIAYRDGVYACTQCRDEKAMDKIHPIHSDCLLDLGITPR